MLRFTLRWPATWNIVCASTMSEKNSAISCPTPRNMMCKTDLHRCATARRLQPFTGARLAIPGGARLNRRTESTA